MSVKIQYWLDSILNSYAQLFFSRHRGFALLLMCASALNPEAGLGGLVAIVFTNIIAYLLGFNRTLIKEGHLGLNALLLGAGLATTYSVNTPFVAVFVAACLLTMFLTLAMNTYFSALGVPSLVLPFMFGSWAVLLATPQFSSLVYSETGLYALNRLYAIGGKELVDFYEKTENLPIPSVFIAYFKSLAAIIFQSNVVSGILIAVGIFLSSRIAFLLSILGFCAGYMFYVFVGADLSQLEYYLIGFNFILTAMAVGGFFFIPNKYTFILAIATAPMIAILIAGSSRLFGTFGLPIFSLPFMATVIILVYVLNLYTEGGRFVKVFVQQYSPERNLYAFKNYWSRFGMRTWYHISLPYFGEWSVSQGHNSKPTHQGDWQYAWDFVIKDEKNNTWHNEGAELEDFYCYKLPVSAPADGYVVAIEDNIEENAVGDINIRQNWGNSIVIKHGEHIYTKISHLLEKSFKVKVGDYVYKGQTLALLGNSGRSPEPHIHFQVQATPYVGSRTMRYPLAYFISKNTEGGALTFREFDYPTENEVVFNIKQTHLLQAAFSFIPGKKLYFDITENDKKREIEWEIWTDAYNQPYIYCPKTKSQAYFVNDGTLFYFTSFVGKQGSDLHQFYLAAYKILLGFYKNVKLADEVPLHEVEKGYLRFAQDLIAPFFIYKKIKYNMTFDDIDNPMRPESINFTTKTEKTRFNIVGKGTEHRFNVYKNLETFDTLMRFSVVDNGKEIMHFEQK